MSPEDLDIKSFIEFFGKYDKYVCYSLEIIRDISDYASKMRFAGF